MYAVCSVKGFIILKVYKTQKVYLQKSHVDNSCVWEDYSTILQVEKEFGTHEGLHC